MGGRSGNFQSSLNVLFLLPPLSPPFPHLSETIALQQKGIGFLKHFPNLRTPFKMRT